METSLTERTASLEKFGGIVDHHGLGFFTATWGPVKLDLTMELDYLLNFYKGLYRFSVSQDSFYNCLV